jgi:hypothetical protein
MGKTGEKPTTPWPFVALFIAAVAACSAVMGSVFGGPDGKRHPWFGITVPAVVIAIGWAGYLSLGWLGVPIFYGTALAVAAALVVGGSYAYMFVGKRQLTRSLNRLSRLSDEELFAVMADPSADVRLACVELMKRGDSVRLPNERLLDLLVSNNLSARLCGLTLFKHYYPEIQIPPQWTPLDPPDLWRARFRSIDRRTD